MSSPSSDSFVHLHVHTDYSALDGAARVQPLVDYVASLGQPAIAITDHGQMSGAHDLYEAATSAGITPIIGVEAYCAPAGTSRHDRDPVSLAAPVPVECGKPGATRRHPDDYSGAGAYTHMTLLAASQTGLRNLMRLNSSAHADGWYRKNRIDIELLSRWAPGIIATTGCPSGEIQTRLRLGDYDGAVAHAAQLRDILDNGNLYVELMDHGLEIEARVAADLRRLARDLGLPLLATNDLHYVTQPEHRWHEAMLALQSGAKLTDPTAEEGGKGRFAFTGDTYYVRTAAEMRALFAETPEACDNTLLIAERIAAENITFAHRDLMPHFPTPNGEPEADYFTEQVMTGLADRLGGSISDDYLARARYEIDVITSKGYPGYFLIVADFVQWAKDNGIPVGPGRGSVGGAIVAWALRITDVDPIRHGLLFERFLNPERESMPDIDLDFSEARRGEVIDYVRRKYGEDNVTQIATYMVMQPKSALRDAARVLGHDYATGDRLAKAWPDPVMGKNLSFDKGLDPANDQYVDTADFRELVNTKQDYKIVQSLAQRFEGVKRGYGMHAAGIIISPEPVADVVPLMRQNGEAPLMTAFDYPTCESLGLVKMDFLGLKTLDTIQYAVEQVRANNGVEVDVPALVEDLADPVTFELLASGETLGVFQLDSAPMRALLKRMVPDSFEDISAVLALYRPGPMGANAHNDYADRKNGRQVVKPIHPEFSESLGEVLGGTHGLIVFQEQVMRIAQEIAGYSLGQADILRRAMGKKKQEVLDAEYVPFSEGARANGYSDEAIQTLWNILVPFAGYSFNASHSAAYGVVSYLTAYLKANFPVEYMAALLTVNASDSTKTSVYLTECRRMGITVASPDVNASGPGYTADGGIVRVGLTGVRNVGDAPAAAIIAERATQPFTSFADFLQRMSGSKANKRVIESLIFAGGFDSLGQHRAQVHAALEPAMKSLQNAKNRAKSKAKRQGTLFDAADVDAIVIDVPDAAMWTKRDTLAKERDMLGMYVSGHPLAGQELALRALSNTTIADILEGTADMTGTNVTAAGLITSIEMKKAKKNGKPWAVITVEDDTAPIEVAVFTHIYPRVKHTLVTDQVVTIEGRLVWKDDEERLALNPDTIKTADMRAAAIKARSALPYEITISNTDLTRNFTSIQQALASHPGTWQVIINIDNQRLQLGDEYRVSPSAALAETLRALGATPTKTAKGAPGFSRGGELAPARHPGVIE